MLIHPTANNILAFSTTRDCVIDAPVSTQFVMPSHQIHGTTTVKIDHEFLSLPPLSQVLALDGVDALSTNIPDVCISVRTADCIPVLLYTESATVISAVHAGWKGTVRRIVEKNIDFLIENYGVTPTELHAIIGPGISLESFEIGDEVYDRFQEEGFPMDRIARRYKKWHIDLWECNRLQLISKGVKPTNIHISGIDTLTNEQFFSARRMKECTGRIINGIQIRVKS